MTLKELVHGYGLTMGEFRRLDPETQAKWRQKQQEENRREQIEKARWWNNYQAEAKKAAEEDRNRWKHIPGREQLADIVQQAMDDPFEEHFLTDEEIAEELKKARAPFYSPTPDWSNPESLAAWLEELDICN